MLRDMSPESAMDQYEGALPYRNMIVGLGLDSDELDRPPSLFYDVFKRAKADGFRLTSHCDFNQKNTHENIRQVAERLGGSGAERIDHGMNAADDTDLMEIIKSKGIGLTICPCAYIRHASAEAVFPRIRKLFDAGIKITIASDDPAYMEDNWVLHNLYMVRDKCNFTNSELVHLQINAVSICWARDDLKRELLDGIHDFEKSWSTQDS
jgi:adenosine deaminase